MSFSQREAELRVLRHRHRYFSSWRDWQTLERRLG